MPRPPMFLAPLGLLLSAPALAHDEHYGFDHNQIQGVRLDIHANVDAYSMFGSGARLEFGLVPNGFIGGHVRDELALSFGADVFFAPINSGWGYYDGGAYVTPIAAAQWNFYLGPRWSVFPEVGVAVHVGFEADGWYDRHGRSYGWVYASPNVGVGARYHFSDQVALLMRVSTPGGFQVGLAL